MCEIKVESNFKAMERHADKAAREDGKTSKATKLNTAQDSRISKETALRLFCDEKPLLCKASAEISLDGYRTSEPQQSKVYRSILNPPAKSQREKRSKNA